MAGKLEGPKTEDGSVTAPEHSNEFSGEAEMVVQARDIAGDVHIYGRSKPEQVTPHELPLPPFRFVNRSRTLERLNRIRDSVLSESETSRTLPVSVVAVTGPPGVGKTALALQWAHSMHDLFTDGALFVDMQGFGPGRPLDATAALDGFLRGIGVPPERIPQVMDRRAAMFRTLTHPRKMLFVLDNVYNSDQIRAVLPAGTKCLTILTSRTQLRGLGSREAIHRVNIDALSESQALELLQQVLGHERIATDPIGASRLVRLCSGLPIALRVIADRAADNEALALSVIADEIEREANRLDALAVEEDQLSDTRAVFSWSYLALSSELQRVFRSLAIHPGRVFGLGPLSAILGLGTHETLSVLRRLGDYNLVAEIQPGRYAQHDLMRLYANECLEREVPQAERILLLRRTLSWYLRTADRARVAVLPFAPSATPLAVSAGDDVTFQDGTAGLSWAELEARNLVACMAAAWAYGQFDYCHKAAVVTSGLFELSYHWPEWQESHEVGLRAAEELGDSLGIALNLLFLGDVHWRRGQAELGKSYFEGAIEKSQELPEKWVGGFALRGLGLIAEEAGRTEEAEAWFHRALPLFAAAGHERGTALSELSIGVCARKTGRLDEAVERGKRAVATLERIDDSWTSAWARIPLGLALRSRGDGNAASSDLRAAAETFRRLGDPKAEAMALEHLLEDPTAIERGDAIAAADRLSWLQDQIRESDRGLAQDTGDLGGVNDSRNSKGGDP